MKTRFLTFIATILLAGQAQAGLILDTPILGGSLLVVANGNVRAEFLGSDAGYFNTLYLDTPSAVGAAKVFDKSSGLHSTVDLGYFAGGTELVFRLFVSNTGLNFFSGDAGRNPDGLPHALAVTSFQDGSYLTTVGFEDLRGGGDKDYNDFKFSLTNVVDPPAAPVPEPSVLLLLGCGLAGLYFQRRKLQLTPARQSTEDRYA